jgi:hypothetical protein
MYDDSSGVGMRPARALVPIRAHDGSTIGKFTVNFRVSTPHTQLPQTMPSVRLVRMDSGGNLVSLTSAASGADPNGYVFIQKPATAAAWYNSGAAQSLVVTCDQNNVADISQYDYFLEIVEEQGLTGYPWQLTIKQKVKAASTGPVGFASTISPIDGITLAAGDRFLLKDNASGVNGIYVWAPGTLWLAPNTRAADMRSSTDFTQGMCVLVDQGNINGGAIFQVASSTTAWLPPGTSFGAYDWQTAQSGVPVNSYVIPTAARATGFYYQATSVAGTATTGATEPTWPTVVGATVQDNGLTNGITWTCQGRGTNNLPFVVKSNLPYPVEGAAIIAHANVWHSVQVEFDNIVDTRFQ